MSDTERLVMRMDGETGTFYDNTYFVDGEVIGSIETYSEITNMDETVEAIPEDVILQGIAAQEAKLAALASDVKDDKILGGIMAGFSGWITFGVEWLPTHLSKTERVGVALGGSALGIVSLVAGNLAARRKERRQQPEVDKIKGRIALFQSLPLVEERFADVE